MATDRTLACRSQVQQIREYMEGGGRINPQKALQMFGCLRLAARIADIEKTQKVDRELIHYVDADNRTRKYMEYWIA